MEDGSWRQLVIIIVFLFFSAFFSAAETALTSLNKLRLKSMMDEGVEGVKKIEKLTSNPNKLLSTILIGNNIVNIGASSLATALALKLAGDNSAVLGITTVLMTVLVLIFSEITPKAMAAQNPEKFAFLVAPGITFFVAVFKPAAAVLSAISGVLQSKLGNGHPHITPLITEAELKTIVNVSHEEGVLEVDERRMINNVFEFGDCSARDVMTPRTDLVAVPYDATYEEIAHVFAAERFSRMPIYKESTDNIIGVLNLKDFIFAGNKNGGFNINEYIRKPYFTYESKPTSELFAIMRTKRIQIAVVLDEYGGTSGIVTLEDLIEEIVGDISDEDDDPVDEIECVKENEYILDGAVKITDVNEMLGTELESEDFDSIGGFVVGMLGHIPDSGEVVECGAIRFIIEEVDKNRVEKLRVYTHTDAK